MPNLYFIDKTIYNYYHKEAICFQIVIGKLITNYKCTHVVHVRLFAHDKCVVGTTIMIVIQATMLSFD